MMADLSAGAEPGETTRPGVFLSDIAGLQAGRPGPKLTVDPREMALEATRPAARLPTIAKPSAAPGAISGPVPKPDAMDTLEAAFSVTFGEEDSDPGPQPSPPTRVVPAQAGAESPAPSTRSTAFSEEDLGAALAGLNDNGAPATPAPAFSPSDAHYGRALARLLVRKGLIQEAELLAELAKSDDDD